METIISYLRIKYTFGHPLGLRVLGISEDYLFMAGELNLFSAIESRSNNRAIGHVGITSCVIV